MQNKKRVSNKNRNSSYYKSQVRKNNRNGYSFYDTARKRQMNSYLRTIGVLFVFMIVVSGFIFLGIFLKNIVADESEPALGEENENMSVIIGEEAEEADNIEEAVDIPQIYYNYNGVYLDIQKLRNLEDLEEFIADIKEKGINAVNIDIKTETGIIPFEIENSTAFIVGAIHANENLPIAEVIEILHENDIYVSGTVVCFKDEYASATYPLYSLTRRSDGLRWSDANGNHWLNAHSEGAREYIKEIVLESVKLNFNEIILSNFFFPNIANTNDLDYGDNTLNRYDMITEFVREIREEINLAAPNIKFGINIPLRYFLTVPHDTTGINPNSILDAKLCDFIMTSFAPSDIPTSISIGGSVIRDAAQNPYTSVKALCEHFKDYIPRVMFRPILQAYDSDGVRYDNDNIKAQKQALFEADIKVWQLLNFYNLY